MNVKECYQRFVANFMFKYYHGAFPPNLRHYFLRVCDKHKHHYLTRAATSSCLSLSKSRTELLKRSILYSAASYKINQAYHTNSVCALHLHKKAMPRN